MAATFWNAFGTPTSAAARLLAADAGTRVRFVPAAGFSGSLDPGITFRAWDRTSGSQGGVADVSDNGGATAFSTAVETASLEVAPVFEPPVLAGIEGVALAYLENEPATAVTAMLTVSDADSPDLAGAAVQITGNYQDGEDLLSFVNTAGITGNWTASTGTLTLSGTDTVANYQAALRAVKYRNTSENPSAAPRTVTFRVNDGSLDSDPVTRDIAVTPVNDPPVIVAPPPLTGEVNTDLQVTGVTVGDVDAGAGNLQLQVAVQHGVVLVPTDVVGGVPASGIANNGTSSLQMIGTLAQLNATLGAGPVYRPPQDFLGTDTLELTADDMGSTGIPGPQDTTVTVDLYIGDVPSGTIYGQKFVDADGDGRRDAAEPGWDGVTVQLLNATSGQVLQTAVTASVELDGQPGIDPLTERGLYTFADVWPGTYRVHELTPADSTQTAPLSGNYVVTVASGESVGIWPAASGRAERPESELAGPGGRRQSAVLWHGVGGRSTWTLTA